MLFSSRVRARLRSRFSVWLVDGYPHVYLFRCHCTIPIQCLQSILNTAVHLVAGASRWDHVTRLLRDHHWLPVEQHIEYKLCMTVHRCLHGEAPRYLPQQLPEQVSDPPRLALSQCHVPWHHSATARSLWPLRARGTSCCDHFIELTLLTFSNASWKHFSLPRLFSFLIF